MGRRKERGQEDEKGMGRRRIRGSGGGVGREEDEKGVGRNVFFILRTNLEINTLSSGLIL